MATLLGLPSVRVTEFAGRSMLVMPAPRAEEAEPMQ
jgi:hypothetical protein